MIFVVANKITNNYFVYKLSIFIWIECNTRFANILSNV